MNKLTYFLALIIPFCIVGIFIGLLNIDIEKSSDYFFWLVVVYIPLLFLLKTKGIEKKTWKEVFLSIPFVSHCASFLKIK